VLVPQLQLGRQMPVAMQAPNPDYPTARPGLAQQGLQVYRSLGCVECHTQQVRPDSGDIDRGCGKRRTVAQDYLYDQPVLTGALRIGPDLANLAARDPKHFSSPWKLQTASNHVDELARKLYLHLYNPRPSVPGSTMPSYRYLFVESLRKSGQQPDPLAIPLDNPTRGEFPGRQIVPKPAAQALVAYLMSLRADAPLYEAPIAKLEIKPLGTNAPPATNAPAASATNAPAQ
jgi:cytochrome c oxidase cbb3-type subunit 2